MSDAINKVFLKFIRMTEMHSGEVNKFHGKTCLKTNFIFKLLPILTNYSDLTMQTDILLRKGEGDNPKPDPHQQDWICPPCF